MPACSPVCTPASLRARRCPCMHAYLPARIPACMCASAMRARMRPAVLPCRVDSQKPSSQSRAAGLQEST
eukprot:175011-Chlamydomonas_euryale.AAC.3